MGKNFSTENDNPESEREHNDDQSYDLFRPMSDEDYLYKEPGEKMTPKQFISRAMIVVLIVVAALFVLLIVEVEDYRRTRSEKEAQREASAQEALKKFLCGSCGLSESDYKVTSSSYYERRMIILKFDVQGKSYTLEDGHYSDYLTEEFREKIKAHLTRTLAESELMRDVKFDVSDIRFLNQGSVKPNLLSTMLTRDKMDSILSPKTEENERFLLRCGLHIQCEITVSGADGRTFSEEQLAGIEDLWYVKEFRIRSDSEENEGQ